MRLKEFLNEKDILSAGEIYSKEELKYRKLGFKKIKKLKDGAYEVWGNFEGNPEDIQIKIKIFHGDFDCDYENTSSLKGSPEIIYGNFYCTNIFELQSLEGGPREIHNGSYNCSSCHLKSLKGLPKIIDGSFFCEKNDLVSLEKFPKEINGAFSVSANSKLKSLEGSPKVVKGFFSCDWCSLTTLENGPQIVDGSYRCSNNLKKFTKEYVKSICKVGRKIFV